MIKSNKEMKNNGTHQSNLLKLLSNATFVNIFPGLAILSERERYALGRIRTPVKSKDSGQLLPAPYSLDSTVAKAFRC